MIFSRGEFLSFKDYYVFLLVDILPLQVAWAICKGRMSMVKAKQVLVDHKLLPVLSMQTEFIRVISIHGINYRIHLNSNLRINRVRVILTYTDCNMKTDKR